MARWVHVAASVAGIAHKVRGEACQDRHTVKRCLSDEDVLIVVASDGAGSAPFGGEGADIVCAVLVTEIQSYLAQGGDVSQITRDLAQQWLACVREEIRARQGGADLRDFACTALVGIVATEAAAFLQIGDGAIVVQRAPIASCTRDTKDPADGDSHAGALGEPQGEVGFKDCSTANGARLDVVIWPQQGEYINTTMFVTDDDYREAVEVVVYRERIDHVAVFTDGLQHLLLDYSGRRAHQPFFGGMFSALRSAMSADDDQHGETLSAELAAYLESAAITERTQDDKTLVLAIRVP